MEAAATDINASVAAERNEEPGRQANGFFDDQQRQEEVQCKVVRGDDEDDSIRVEEESKDGSNMTPDDKAAAGGARVGVGGGGDASISVDQSVDGTGVTPDKKEALEGARVGAGANIQEDMVTNEDARARSHQDDDPEDEVTNNADQPAPAAFHAEAEQSRGGGSKPLSPQQQQHASPATGTRVGGGDIAGGGGGGVDGDASGRALSAPMAPTWPAHCDPTYRMPEELAIRVLVEGEVKEISIKVERFEGRKVFQGGYRHRVTGREFHHVSTQIGQRERPIKETSHLRNRDTQTYKIKTTTTQTTNECGTQMARKDMHLDDGRDTFKTAGEYQTAGEYWRVRERKTVTIQRFWRGFSARSRVWARREEKWAMERKELEAMAEEEGRTTQERQREMQRRMNPTTVQDFEVLYNELDQWRKAETERIKQAEGGERRKVALRELLHKETRLLQTIDRLKITAAHDGKERRTRRMLELMSAPKRWETSDGEVSEINTPWTTRARELQELYEALEAPLLGVEERLDVLLHLKWTVSEFDCRLTRDIAELVDREADLLSRGRGEASLRPLRLRIRNLFLRFTETPDFNPEATRFVRVPPKYGKLTDEGMAGLTSVVSCK